MNPDVREAAVLRSTIDVLESALAELCATDVPDLSMDEFLTAERLRREWTLQQVGRKIGVAAATVGSWERGDRDPGLAQREKWAAVYGYRIALQPIEPDEQR